MRKILFVVVIVYLTLSAGLMGQYGKWTELIPAHSHNEDFFYPKYRSGAGMAKLTDGKVLLFGGNGGGKRNNDTWIFDLKLNTWTKLETKHTPPHRAEHGLAQLFDGKVLLFGGHNGQDIIYDDTWIFDMITMDWQNMNPEKHPSSRYGFGMSNLSEGKAIIFGGDLLTDSNGYHYGHETWIYDYSGNIWREYEYITELTPTSRVGTGLAQLSEGKILMFGGYISMRLNDTWIFDEEKSRWIEIFPTSSPVGLDGMAFCKLTNNFILLNGGSDGNEVGNDSTWIFSFKDTNWYNMGNSEGIGFRGFHNLSQIENGKAILTGFQAYDDTWLYELDTNYVNVENQNTIFPEIFTNVNNNQLQINYNLKNQAKAQIEIYNINGIKVYNSGDFQASQGINSRRIDVGGFARGVYIVVLKAGTEYFSDKFVMY